MSAKMKEKERKEREKRELAEANEPLEKVDAMRRQLADLAPIAEEPSYVSSHDTLLRFLRGRGWHMKDAEKQLRSAIEWRREKKPSLLDCRWCHERAGYHALRPVGFDREGRTVLYMCFEQQTSDTNHVEDTMAHVVYTMENARRMREAFIGGRARIESPKPVLVPPTSASASASTASGAGAAGGAVEGNGSPPDAAHSPSIRDGSPFIILIFDCTGFSLSQFNPKIAKELIGTFATSYPEHLEKLIIVHHNIIIHNIWKAIKAIVDPRSVKKMHFIKKEEKIRATFDFLFSKELSSWLMDEMRLNRTEPITPTQREFWKPPLTCRHHDPRGTQSYINQFVDPYLKFVLNAEMQAADPAAATTNGSASTPDGSTSSPVAPGPVHLSFHRPHPNIVDYQMGRLVEPVPRAKVSTASAASADPFAKYTPEELKEMGYEVNKGGRMASATDNGAAASVSATADGSEEEDD